MHHRADLRILGLSRKQAAVLAKLRTRPTTPLEIARATRISRTAIYAILRSFKSRGLAQERITDGKKLWQLAPAPLLKSRFSDAKRILVKPTEGTKEVSSAKTTITLHRGKRAVKNILENIVVKQKNKRWRGLQGDVGPSGWDKVFTVREINRINEHIKRNKIIVESVYPTGWFERHTRELGVEWAAGFEGRSVDGHLIDPAYFKHGGQLWVFEDSLYLVDLNAELVIEIKNSEIRTMIIRLLEFVEDHSVRIDVNALLRTLINNSKKI
jgi:hypothetical protein